MRCHDNKLPHPIDKQECHQPGTNHGRIMYIKFVETENLLVIGFECGLIHIIKLSMNDFGSGEFIRGVYCDRVKPKHVNCYVACDTGLEIWTGCDSSVIEVWDFPGDKTRWHSKKPRKTDSISLQHPAYTFGSSAVTKMAVAPDGESIFAFVTDRSRNAAICRINREDHRKLQFWQCMVDCKSLSILCYLLSPSPSLLPSPLPVSCFTMTSQELLVGTKDGQVVVFPFASLQSHVGLSTASPKFATKLIAHSGEVNHVFAIDGVVKENGFTSPYFNTFMGRQSKDIPCRFIISVGQGCVNFNAHNKKGVHNPATIREGCYLSVWFI